MAYISDNRWHRDCEILSQQSPPPILLLHEVTIDPKSPTKKRRGSNPTGQVKHVMSKEFRFFQKGQVVLAK